MRILYILALLAVAIVAVAFTAQNGAEVAVKFFGLSASGSLSLVLVVTLSIGIVIGILIMAPSVFKRAIHASGLRRKLAKAEKATLDAEKPSPKPDDAAATGTALDARSGNGAIDAASNAADRSAEPPRSIGALKKRGKAASKDPSPSD